VESCNFKTKFGKVESLEVVIPYKEQPLKFCSQCRRWKFVSDDFHQDRRSSDGLMNRCKECNKANSAIQVRKNREKDRNL
jgi:hypothetical protein